jgi:molybdopterin-guanine dinucleotide biosynthesis protein MobB
MMSEIHKIETIRRLPILGVCGWSGSGKTTLIEAILPRLLAGNLKVVVVKHDVHTIDVDRTGKDSDRFFQAGADVYLQGNEELSRLHPDAAPKLLIQLIDLAKKYDLILVEGHKQSLLPKVWLLHEGEKNPPAAISDIRLVLPRNARRVDEFFAFLTGWLSAQLLKMPVYGCIYATETDRRGGKGDQVSAEARERLRQTREILRDYTQDIVVVGNNLPEDCTDCMQLSRSPGVTGPLAGPVTAMRWQPLASWLAVDCAADCSEEVWQRFLVQRRPGVWGILPPSDDTCGFGLYPAYFDFRSATLLENLSKDKDFPATLASHPKMYAPDRSEYPNKS